jgi:hypothetical protein
MSQNVGGVPSAASPLPSGPSSLLEVGTLGKTRAAAGGRLERLASGGRVSRHFEQVAPHGKQPVAGGDPLVVIESGEQAQPRLGSFDHGQGERAIQRRHRVRGEAVEPLVEEQDLGPVGVPGLTGLVVDGCDRGLELVCTRGPPAGALA